jgi:hypothetical protein
MCSTGTSDFRAKRNVILRAAASQARDPRVDAARWLDRRGFATSVQRSPGLQCAWLWRWTKVEARTRDEVLDNGTSLHSGVAIMEQPMLLIIGGPRFETCSHVVRVLKPVSRYWYGTPFLREESGRAGKSRVAGVESFTV